MTAEIVQSVALGSSRPGSNPGGGCSPMTALVSAETLAEGGGEKEEAKVGGEDEEEEEEEEVTQSTCQRGRHLIAGERMNE